MIKRENDQSWNEIIAAIKRIASAEEEDFLGLLSLSGLDRTRDLRNSDLQGTDLTNQDLSGIDFTGSLFDGAIVDNTSFSSSGIDLKQLQLAYVGTVRLDGKQVRDPIGITLGTTRKERWAALSEIKDLRTLETLVRQLLPLRSISEAKIFADQLPGQAHLLRYSPTIRATNRSYHARALGILGKLSEEPHCSEYANDRTVTVATETTKYLSAGRLPAVCALITGPYMLRYDIARNVHAIPNQCLRPSVQRLQLGNTRINDIEPVSGLAQLVSLDLRGAQIHGIGALSGLTNLQTLNLSYTKVSDVGALSGLTALQSLNLGGTEVSDVGALSGLTALQSLYLWGTEVSDIGALSGLTALKYLSLRGTEVSDVGALSDLTALQDLSLRGTEVSDVGALSGLTALQYLSLDGTEVSDVGALSGLTALRYLNLAETQVSDVGALSELPDLKNLVLPNGVEDNRRG